MSGTGGKTNDQHYRYTLDRLNQLLDSAVTDVGATNPQEDEAYTAGRTLIQDSSFFLDSLRTGTLQPPQSISWLLEQADEALNKEPRKAFDIAVAIEGLLANAPAPTNNGDNYVQPIKNAKGKIVPPPAFTPLDLQSYRETAHSLMGKVVCLLDAKDPILANELDGYRSRININPIETLERAFDEGRNDPDLLTEIRLKQLLSTTPNVEINEKPEWDEPYKAGRDLINYQYFLDKSLQSKELQPLQAIEWLLRKTEESLDTSPPEDTFSYAMIIEGFIRGAPEPNPPNCDNYIQPVETSQTPALIETKLRNYQEKAHFLMGQAVGTLTKSKSKGDRDFAKSLTKYRNKLDSRDKGLDKAFRDGLAHPDYRTPASSSSAGKTQGCLSKISGCAIGIVQAGVLIGGLYVVGVGVSRFITSATRPKTDIPQFPTDKRENAPLKTEFSGRNGAPTQAEFSEIFQAYRRENPEQSQKILDAARDYNTDDRLFLSKAYNIVNPIMNPPSTDTQKLALTAINHFTTEPRLLRQFVLEFGEKNSSMLNLPKAQKVEGGSLLSAELYTDAKPFSVLSAAQLSTATAPLASEFQPTRPNPLNRHFSASEQRQTLTNG
jgi:hypothetical protein